MIDLYTWPTPNGHKVHIFLEETGLPYKVHAVNIGQGDQFKPSFLKISPNNKMPAIVDRKGPGGKPIAIFESGAILIYLAEKTGKFLPKKSDVRGYYSVMQWLMFQMASVGPMQGQAHHFNVYAPKRIKFATDRYVNETTRIYGVIDRRLKKSKFIAGDKYTIADMAIYPWIVQHDRAGQDLKNFPSLKKWFDKMGKRPAVKRAYQVLADARRPGPMSADDKKMLFGPAQYKRRKVAA